MRIAAAERNMGREARMAFGRRTSGRVFLDAFIGAVSGLAASWVMEKAQGPIMKAGGERTREREAQAQAGVPPATVQTAQRAAALAGISIPAARIGAAAEAVHYLTGAAFGAAFGVAAPLLAMPALAAGPLYGAAVWLLNDEGLVPALGLSRRPWEYPASTHVKSLGAHVVYGAATDVGFRLLEAAVPSSWRGRASAAGRAGRLARRAARSRWGAWAADAIGGRG